MPIQCMTCSACAENVCVFFIRSVHVLSFYMDPRGRKMRAIRRRHARLYYCRMIGWPATCMHASIAKVVSGNWKRICHVSHRGLLSRGAKSAGESDPQGFKTQAGLACAYYLLPCDITLFIQ